MEKETSDIKNLNYVRGRGRIYNEVERNIVKTISEERTGLRQEHVEMVRNLAILSGATASFSIILLTNHPNIFLKAGIILLIVNGVLCFVHLIGTIGNNAKFLKNLDDLSLSPIKDASKNCLDFLRGKKSFDHWSKDESDFLENKYDEIKTALSELSNRANDLDYSGEILLAVFGFANVLVIASILFPDKLQIWPTF